VIIFKEYVGPMFA